MENNERGNNRGIFYAVMGIATLVITVIGATFAYFVATTNSADNAIRSSSTTVTLQFDDNTKTGTGTLVYESDGTTELTTGIKTNLIPVDTLHTDNTTIAAFKNGGYTGMNVAGTSSVNYKYAGAGVDDCRDANGNFICSVYSFTVTNPSEAATGVPGPSQKVYPTFTVKTNGFTNLKYALFKGNPAQVAASTNGWDVNGTAVTAEATDFAAATLGANGGKSFLNTTSATVTRKHVIGNPGDLIIKGKTLGATGSSETWSTAGTGDWDRLVQILDAGESMTYTIIIWLEENYSNQASEMNKKFEASVSFTTEGDNTGVTGSLIVS